jgi:hypothetical protein
VWLDKRWRNSLFETIVEAGLEPGDFALAEEDEVWGTWRIVQRSGALLFETYLSSQLVPPVLMVERRSRRRSFSSPTTPASRMATRRPKEPPGRSGCPAWGL